MKLSPNKGKWHLCRWHPIRFLGNSASFLAASSATSSTESFPGRFEEGFSSTLAQQVGSQQVPWLPGAEFSSTFPDVASQEISPGLQQGFPVHLGLLAPWGLFPGPSPKSQLRTNYRPALARQPRGFLSHPVSYNHTPLMGSETQAWEAPPSRLVLPYVLSQSQVKFL